jgi:hypothetical protein
MTYKVQIDDTVRDATSAEAAAIDDQRADTEAQAAASEAKQAATSSARAKLAALGLTDAEVKAIIGG